VTASWHGEPAVRVQGTGVAATFVPRRGGKIVSLCDTGGREWLVRPPRSPPPPARPGAAFVEAEMCGWDECVPTINACRVNRTILPDHGEAWTCAWDDQGGAWWGFEGTALGYRFARAIHPTPSGLRLSYRLEATGARPVPAFWAAHPQFAAPPGTRVVLPAHVERVIAVYGARGEMKWNPEVARVDTLAPGGARKMWLDRGDRADWAALQTPNGARLRLSWDAALVPYLGLWFDREAFAPEPVVALEPATGWYDALDYALANRAVVHVSEGAPLRWWVDVVATEGDTQ
jgi:hypothetical protein